MPVARRSWVAYVVAIVALAATACRGSSSPPISALAPTPFDPNAPRIGAHTGNVTIDFLGANYAPGFTVPGCGLAITGCAGLLRLTFRLTTTAAGGPVLRTAAWLHGANKVPCLAFVGPPFTFPANTSVLLDAVFDQADPKCTLPFETTDLGVNVEGVTTANGRQEFGIRYRFTP